MFLQFSHEALAETHHFSVCFSFRIEVRSTFTTTDRKTSQDVFEDLFESEEFQDPLVNSWMETKTTFVRTYSRVELNTVTTVYLDVSFTVNPRNTERNYAFRFCNTSQDVFFDVFRVFFKNRFQSAEELFNSLKEFSFVAVTSFYSFEGALDIFFSSCHVNSPL